MLLALLAYLAGILTIISPCILPVLPFVFARAGKPFMQSVLPMLIGMALTFMVVASLAAVAGGWVVEANRFGRYAALLLLALFGVTLLFPQIATRVMQPLVNFGNKLSQDQIDNKRSEAVSSFILGIATGFLWAPCAGPVLGLILTGAALQGASVQTSLLLLAYAAGAATSLAVALLIGGKVFTIMKRSLGASEWIRRGLGAAVLAAVVAIALGADTGFLTNVSAANTASLEQSLIDKLHPPKNNDDAGGAMMAANNDAMKAGDNGAMMAGNNAMMMKAKPAGDAPLMLPVESAAPSLDGAVQWLNSPPLTNEQLKGKVVLVDFWTYSCINCLRALPYVEAWAKKYQDQGLVVIGVHAPEFAFERDVDNVKKAIADNGITYPVAIDNDYTIWKAFNNEYWPAHYFIDAKGNVRHHHFGEGDYDKSERVIQQLLAEANGKPVDNSIVQVNASGAQADADNKDMRSPETYVGTDRSENFASPGGAVADAAHDYSVGDLTLNQWGLAGKWTVGKEQAALDDPDGAIAYRFHARDLHLVLGPGADNKPVRFKVTIDGQAPGDNHGTDVAADGTGTVTGQRLYQLVRQCGDIQDHTFQIQFLDSNVQAYAFTFG